MLRNLISQYLAEFDMLAEMDKNKHCLIDQCKFWCLGVLTSWRGLFLIDCRSSNKALSFSWERANDFQGQQDCRHLEIDNKYAKIRPFPLSLLSKGCICPSHIFGVEWALAMCHLLYRMPTIEVNHGDYHFKQYDILIHLQKVENNNTGLSCTCERCSESWRQSNLFLHFFEKRNGKNNYVLPFLIDYSQCQHQGRRHSLSLWRYFISS